MSNREKNIPIRPPDPFRVPRTGASHGNAPEDIGPDGKPEREVSDGGGGGFMLFLLALFLLLVAYLLQ